MCSQATAVTLDADSIIWLKGRAGTAVPRSVSELLDASSAVRVIR